MGFVAPLALFLLSAVSLPWLVHRMRQRDLPTVTLPTIALLQRAMAVTQRRRALEDLLLMLTRMLIVALIAFALASPFVWGAASMGDGRPQSVVIVIDDSMSMGRAEAGSTLLEQARARAASVIAALPKSSQVGVIAAGRPPRTLATLGSPDAALGALTSLGSSPALGTELSAAIDLACAALSASNHQQRGVIVLSDGMGQGQPPRATDDGVEVRYETLGQHQAIENLAIADASARRDPDAAGGYRVQVDVRAFHSARQSVPVRLRVGEQALTPVELRLESGHGRLELTLPPEQVRDLSVVRVELVSDDALSIDDRRDVLLRDPNVLRVLLVNGDPHPANSADELHFLARALPLQASQATPLSIETTDTLGLEHAALDAVDLVWLANTEAPSAETARRLTTFVESGGSLVISAGDHVDPAAYNARLAALLPARIEAAQTLGEIDFKTDAMEADAWGIAAASIGHARTTERLITQGDGHVVLSYADGVAALLRRGVQRGRVVLWTTSIDGDWTDLPFRPGFLALSASLMTALSPVPASAPVIEPGQAVRLAVPEGSLDATLIDPAQKRHPLRLDAPVITTTSEQTSLPGAYAVEVTEAGGSIRQLARAAFVVAPPIDESDLTPTAQPVAVDAERAEATQQSRAQHPFDGPLYALLAPLFLLEAWLRLQRRRASTTRAIAPKSV